MRVGQANNVYLRMSFISKKPRFFMHFDGIPEEVLPNPSGLVRYENAIKSRSVEDKQKECCEGFPGRLPHIHAAGLDVVRSVVAGPPGPAVLAPAASQGSNFSRNGNIRR